MAKKADAMVNELATYRGPADPEAVAMLEKLSSVQETKKEAKK